MKIIIVSDTASINGGAAKVAIQSALGLSNCENNQVYFFCGTGPICAELKESKVKVCCTNQKSITKQNPIKGVLQGINNKKACRELSLLIEEIGVEDTIIHFHVWSKILSSALFKVTKRYHIPVVITAHDYGTICPNGCFFNFKKNSICSLAPKSLKCQKTNCDTKPFLFKIFRNIRFAKNIKYIKGNKLNYIFISKLNQQIFEKSSLYQYTGFELKNPVEQNFKVRSHVENANTFLFVGRLSREKGLDLFCSAITEVKFRAVVIGDGPELPRLKAKFHNIEFVGWKNSNEIDQYAKNSCALVFPSQWYEAAPLTITEMMGRYHLPCIISDLCAGKDLIENDKNGLIFDGNSRDDLISKMIIMKKKAIIYQEFIEKNFVYSEYSLKNHVKGLNIIYKKILGEVQ